MGRRAAILGLACAAPLTASATASPIDGTYGNEAGCTYARLSNHGTNVEAAPGGRHHVAMTCSSEGEGPEGNYEDKAEISGDPVSGYTVRFADGSSWEPLKKCG